MDRLSDLKTIDIYGVKIAQTSISNLIHHLEMKLLANGIKGFVTVTGVHGIIESQKSNNVAQAHSNSYLSIPDGTPLVWYSKSKGSKSIERCFGPEMIPCVCCAFTKGTINWDIRYGSSEKDSQFLPPSG